MSGFRFWKNVGMISLLCLIVVACGNKPTQEQGASGGASASPSVGKTWTAEPAMTIDTSKTYQAEVETSKGKFTIDLYSKEAPRTVNNFVFLAKENFYNGIIFHRISKTFMIQTGDPKGNGTGGPGYRFGDELWSKNYEVGTVAMANSGKNTNGSQFFICTGTDCAASLNSNPAYSVFGKVSAGMETVQKIANTPVSFNPGENAMTLPNEKVTINSIVIKTK